MSYRSYYGDGGIARNFGAWHGIAPPPFYGDNPVQYGHDLIDDADMRRLNRLRQQIVELEMERMAALQPTPPIPPAPTHKKEGPPMEALFHVYVATKKREVLMNGKPVIAATEADARFEADVDKVLREKGLKPRDVTVRCIKVCEVEVEKEPEKVIVQKGE